MADVPPQVNHGFITGRFVQFFADSGDTGTIPDEIPLTGTVMLTPSVTLMRFATTNPPRTAIMTKIPCKIVDGDLLGPDGTVAVSVLASDQPAGDPNFLQWLVDVRLDGVTTQPAPVTIEVPVNGTIDLTTVIPSPPEPPAIIIVSTADRQLAEAAAADAELSASDADSSATAAAASATAAANSLSAMPKWWFGTQAAYDAIATKDPATLYVITG
jgi:hypothetical protein